MRKHSARRLVIAEAAHLALGEYRPIEGAGIALGDVVEQQLPLVLQGLVQHRAAHGTGCDASDRRVQRAERDLRAGNLARDLDQFGEVPFGRLVTGGIHAQHIGERTDLRALVEEGRRLDPGVFPVVVEIVVFWLGLTVERM